MDTPDINQVFEWLNLEGGVVSVERVLHVMAEGKSWMVIRLPMDNDQQGTKRRKRDFPFERHSHEYASALDANTLRPALKDPFEHASICVSGAPQTVSENFSENKNASVAENRYSKHQQRLLKNWLLIKDIVQNPLSLFGKTRGKLIAEAAKRTGRQKSEIYSYCIRYWQRGQVAGSIASLYARLKGERQEVKAAGQKRGPRGKIINGEAMPCTHIAIGPEEREKLRKGIKRFRLKEKRPLLDAYNRTIREYWSEKIDSPNGLELKRPLPVERRPSFKQFLYAWEKFRTKNNALVKRAMLGDREFTLTQRILVNNHTRTADRPGQRFEIDAHIADCELVHSITRLPIDRPTVYLVVDIFCHEIVGFAVTLEPPSYMGAALALINTFTEKVSICKQYGVDIEPDQWPCHHLCKVLVADRGELFSDNADVLSTVFGIDRDILPAYRPDMKPLVERFFKRLNEKLRHRLPGAVYGPKRRGERNPKLNARLDVKQYTELVIRTILELNSEWMANYNLEKAIIVDKVNPVPLDLWNWGVKNRSGVLRQKTKEFVQANLLPRAHADVTRSGLEFDGFEYALPSNISEDWQLASSDVGAKVEIAYDPRLVDAIHLCNSSGIAGKYEACSLKKKHDAHLGCSWREVKLWSKGQSLGKKKMEETTLTKRMENDIRMDAILREAEAKHESAIHPSLSKSSFLKGSSENRADARRAERQATPIIKSAIKADESSVIKESVASNKIVQFNQKSRSAQEAEYLRSLRDKG